MHVVITCCDFSLSKQLHLWLLRLIVLTSVIKNFDRKLKLKEYKSKTYSRDIAGFVSRSSFDPLLINMTSLVRCTFILKCRVCLGLNLLYDVTLLNHDSPSFSSSSITLLVAGGSASSTVSMNEIRVVFSLLNECKYGNCFHSFLFGSILKTICSKNAQPVSLRADIKGMKMLCYTNCCIVLSIFHLCRTTICGCNKLSLIQLPCNEDNICLHLMLSLQRQ